MKRELQTALDKEQMCKIASLQLRLRDTRQELVNRPPVPGPAYQGTLAEYAKELSDLETAMEETAHDLAQSRRQRDAVLEINETLVNDVGIVNDTVVLHYKKHMDDKDFLPRYPEGVVWLREIPQDQPNLCEHLDVWKTRPSPNVKSPFEEFRDNIQRMLTEDGLFSEEENGDWVAWMKEQDKCAADYADESPWLFPKAVRIEEADLVMNTEDQVSNAIQLSAYFASSVNTRT